LLSKDLSYGRSAKKKRRDFLFPIEETSKSNPKTVFSDLLFVSFVEKWWKYLILELRWIKHHSSDSSSKCSGAINQGRILYNWWKSIGVILTVLSWIEPTNLRESSNEIYTKTEEQKNTHEWEVYIASFNLQPDSWLTQPSIN
jgi:hypothetical protein